jgi:hypothetical protein
LPFSINDSAVALVHDSEVMLPRQRIAVDILVSDRADIDPKVFEKVRSVLEGIKITHVPEAAVPASSKAPTLSENRSQLIERIDRMIENLDNILASGNYKQNDIEKLIQSIDDAQKQLEAKP